MNDIVKAALDITGYAIESSGIELTLQLAGDLPLILADADQLHQVLLNLIINAQQSLQECPPPRRIRITSRFDAQENVLRVCVADNGPGIPAQLRPRVFEPFFTTKPTGKGTGVGLAVSLGIVEAHGGTLSVDCGNDGGAVFTIVLPVAGVSAAATPFAVASSPSPGVRSVLVVDDEPEIRESLAQILASAQHRVMTAGSGREAVARLSAERYDVVLTDIRMPDIDGRALYEIVAQRWPWLAARVVFVTGDTLASELREFVSKTGRRVIEKPFLPAEVRRVVAEVAVERETVKRD